MQPELVRLSKFISKVLRHQPQLIGLQLDEHGWVEVAALIAAAQRKGMPLDRAVLEQIVTENDKQRFAFSPDGTRIRASQGHSLPVDLGLTPQSPPDLLYHGTGQHSVAAILREGLRKGRRHAVHLSTDAATARVVGARHGQPVVLLVQARRMAADGYAFTRSDNGVWLVDSVPPQYINVHEPPAPGHK